MVDVSRMRVPLACGRALIQAAATLAIATNALREENDRNAKILIGAAIVIASLLAWDIVKAALRDKSMAAKAARDRAMRELLSNVLVQIEELTKISCPSLGVHLFEKKWRIAPFRRWRADRPVRREMVRVYRFRVNSVPTPCDVRWPISTGLIGRAWSKRDFDVLDVREWESDLDAGDVDSASAEERLGLTGAEYRRVRGRYDAIAAVPIVSDGGSVVGILSVDARYVGAYHLFNKEPAIAVLRSNARTAASIFAN